MDLVDLILINIGVPDIVFYLAMVILLIAHYRRRLAMPLSLLYAFSLASVTSCVWEVPKFVVFGDFGSNFLMGFLYLIPLPLMLVFNIRIRLPGEVHLGVGFLCWVAVMAYYYFLISSSPGFYGELVYFYGWQNLSTFIPRGATALFLSYILEPEAKP